MASKSSSTSPIILIAVVAFGILGGYLYYSQFVGAPEPIPTPVVATQDSLSRLATVNLNFAIFDQPLFQSLRIYGEAPVQPGTTGRQDIFAPF